METQPTGRVAKCRVELINSDGEVVKQWLSHTGMQSTGHLNHSDAVSFGDVVTGQSVTIYPKNLTVIVSFI